MAIKLVDLTKKKYCSGCGKHKDKSEFAMAKNHPDGLQNWCRQCNSDYWTSPEMRRTIQKKRDKQRERYEGLPSPPAPVEEAEPEPELVAVPEEIFERSLTAYGSVDTQDSNGEVPQVPAQEREAN